MGLVDQLSIRPYLGHPSSRPLSHQCGITSHFKNWSLKVKQLSEYFMSFIRYFDGLTSQASSSVTYIQVERRSRLGREGCTTYALEFWRSFIAVFHEVGTRDLTVLKGRIVNVCKKKFLDCIWLYLQIYRPLESVL